MTEKRGKKKRITAPRRVSSLPLPCPAHDLLFWLFLNAEMHISPNDSNKDHEGALFFAESEPATAANPVVLVLVRDEVDGENENGNENENENEHCGWGKWFPLGER